MSKKKNKKKADESEDLHQQAAKSERLGDVLFLLLFICVRRQFADAGHLNLPILQHAVEHDKGMAAVHLGRNPEVHVFAVEGRVPEWDALGLAIYLPGETLS